MLLNSQGSDIDQVVWCLWGNPEMAIVTPVESCPLYAKERREVTGIGKVGTKTFSVKNTAW